MTDTGTLIQPTLKELKRVSKSFEAIQQSFVIALLNMRGIGFRFRKPERKSQKTIQTLIIEEISDENGTQNYQELLKQQCAIYTNQELENAGFTNLKQENIETIASITKLHYDEHQTEVLKQIKRHKDANCLAFAFNWLLDKARANKISFKERSTKPSKLTVQMLKISEADDEENGYHFMKDDIEKFGTEVSRYIAQGFEGVDRDFELQPRDEEIMRIHNEIVSKLGQDNGKTEIVRKETILTQPSVSTVQNDMNIINIEGGENVEDGNELVVPNPDQSTFELLTQPCPSVISDPMMQIQYQPEQYSLNQYFDQFYVQGDFAPEYHYTDTSQSQDNSYDYTANGFQQGFVNPPMW